MERPINTAGKDRATQAVIEEHIRNTEKRHTPVSRVKVKKDKKTGIVNIDVFTSRPEVLRMEAREIEAGISQHADGKQIKVNVVAEARAVAKFIRMSPRKARFVLEAIKGKRVSEAIDILRFVPNHASDPILKVLRSAAANALDGWGASTDELKVHAVIADGGPTLKRIRARAQGRAYRILKRTTHLTIVLLETPRPAPKRRPAARPKPKAAPVAKAAVKAEPETPVEKPVTQIAPEVIAPAAPQAAAPEAAIEATAEAAGEQATAAGDEKPAEQA